MATPSSSALPNNPHARDATHSLCARHPEKKDKIIEIPDRSGRFHVNEEVIICGQNSMGLQAVLLAFVIPLVIVVGAIVIGTNLQWDETTSGLTGLSLLLPYYCILYLMRDKLKRRFIFTLKKLN